MVTLNTTPNRGYQEPAVGNTLEVDVGRLIAALRAIDIDVANALAAIVSKAGLASPVFTGTPTAPTAAPGTDSGQLATTAFVKAALVALVDSAPGALDTLNELAAALGDDPNFSATVLTAIGLKANSADVTAALALKADAAALAGKADNLQPYVDVASAATTEIGTAASQNVRITGTATITGLGTAAAGTVRDVLFAGILTLTHNGTSLILQNGGSNIVTAAGDTMRFVSLGSGNWRQTDWQRSSPTTKTALAHITDTKAQGTAAQTLTATTWNTRQINTENYDPDGIVSISSNQFSLSSGSDYLVKVVASCSADNSTASISAVRIYDVTGSAPVQSMGYFQNTSPSQATASITIEAILTGGKTYRIDHYSSGSKAAGTAANLSGMSEIYLSIIIQRLNYA